MTRPRQGRFQQEVRTGTYLLLADEPIEVGGLDSGPGPYDFLLACSPARRRAGAGRRRARRLALRSGGGLRRRARPSRRCYSAATLSIGRYRIDHSAKIATAIPARRMIQNAASGSKL